jgi:hypothetical protein
LMAGRSKAWSIEGRRKQSAAWGLGRMDVEAVVVLRSRNAWRLSRVGIRKFWKGRERCILE